MFEHVIYTTASRTELPGSGPVCRPALSFEQPKAVGTGIAAPGHSDDKSNGHDDRPRSGAQTAADGLDGRDRHQVAQTKDGVQDAPGDQSDGPDHDDFLDEVSLDEFNAQLEASAIRDAKTALEIGPEEFDRAREIDQAQGLHGDGDVQLVMAENLSRQLTKFFRPTPDGKVIVKDQSPGTGYGRLVRVTLAKDRPIASLAKVLTNCRQNQAFIPGRLPGLAPMRRMIIKAKFEALPAAERALPGSGPLYRGKHCICYERGKPALLIIDFDAKDLPDAVRERIEAAGGLARVLAAIDPEWTSVGFLERPSVSTGIRDRRTGVTTPGGGLHLYVIVEDGSDLARYVRVMFDRLILAGFGWVLVSRAGGMLKRSPIDKAASGIGYWLAFEANAVLEPGPHGDCLEHVPGARSCVAREGSRLDTQALPDLTDDEQGKLAEIWANLKLEKEPEARAIKLKRGAKDIARLVKVGVPQDDAERLVLERQEMGRLSLDGLFWFDEKLPSGERTATGWELLENAADWFADGKRRTGADPQEPDYPNVGSVVVAKNKALWKSNDHSQQTGLFVTSRAHGGQKFILAYDAADVVALMDERKARGASAIARLAELKDIYRQYMPSEPPLADKILRAAGLPRQVLLEFDDADAPELGNLVRERLIEVLRDQSQWEQLGRLRCLGRFRDEALAELWAEDDLIGVYIADWDRLTAKLTADDEAAEEKAAADGATARDPSGLPVIQIKKGQLHITADKAEKALVARPSTRPVLQRGGDLVRPCSIPAKAADDQEVDAVSLKLMTTAMLMDDLAHCAEFMRFDARKKKLVPVDPPKELAEKLLSRAGGYLRLLPRVLGIICAPTLRPDGSVLHEPGYDPTTQRYHMPTSNVTLSSALMGSPTRDDALVALNLLIGLLSEFPFATAVDRSVGLSLCITPAVRTALHFSPMHLVRAALPGSGKSFLVNLAHVIQSGRFCPAVTAGETVNELEKRIDTMLLNGHPMFSLDNLSGDLFSNKLCNALTEAGVSPRVLGQSKTVDIDNTYFIAATGNNVRPVGDLTRRVLTSDLDPKVERPELRQFQGDPVKTIMADRGKYLSACLIIPRAYILAGMPGLLPPLNGFVNWSNFVRSALVWLGQEDPVGCLDAICDDDPGKQNLRVVVDAWKTAIGLDKPLTVKELLDKAGEVDPISGASLFPAFEKALAAATPRAPLDADAMGYWLRDAKGKVIDNVQIVTGPLRNGIRTWLLRSCRATNDP
jgi:putative DNA primase/helicase